MSSRIGAIVFKDTPDARQRFAELGLDTDYEDTFNITLNGTDTNGQHVVAKYVQVDNFENIAPVLVTINGIRNSVAPYTRTTFEIATYTPEIGIYAYEGTVKIYISEAKLGIGDGTNDLAKDNAFNMGTYLPRDGGAAMLADFDAGGFLVRNAKDPVADKDLVTLSFLTNTLKSDIVSLARFATRDKPIGIGNQDNDTAAFTAAFLFQRNARRKIDGPVFGGSLYPFVTIFVPPGDYKVAGGFGAGYEGMAIKCDPHGVTIKIADGKYFWESNLRQDFTYIENFAFIGGKGVLHHTYTDVNVTSYFHVVRNNVFNGYTECAINSNALDFPYWEITGNQFAGASGSYTKGVALRGLQDGTQIRGNAFLANSIHLQIGPIKSGSTYVRENDFISFEVDRTQIDIALVGNDQPGSYGTNCGAGTVILDNKFGNEGIGPNAKAPRIAILSMTGTDGASNRPNITWQEGNDGANYLNGISIDGNRFVTGFQYDPNGNNDPAKYDGVNASLIVNYLRHADNIYFGDRNTFEGGSYNYLVEHMVTDIPQKCDFTNTSWKIKLGRLVGTPFRKGVSNFPIGVYDDPNGVSNDPYAVTRGKDVLSVKLKQALNKDGWGTPYGNIQKADAPNVDNVNDATDVTFQAAGAAVALSSLDISANAGNIFWLTGTIKKAPAAPASRLFINVSYYDGSASRDIRRFIVNVPPVGFQQIDMPLPIPPTASYVTAFIACNDSAINLRVILGDFQLTRGRTPMAL